MHTFTYMTFITNTLTSVRIFILFFLFLSSVKGQISFQTPYQIKNNTGLAVCIDFTVSCNKGTETSWAKLVAIPANSTYTVPAPYFNGARTNTDCDISIQISGLFGGKAVNFENQTTRYNEDMGLYNTSVKGHPLGVMVWSPLITNIW